MTEKTKPIHEAAALSVGKTDREVLREAVQAFAVQQRLPVGPPDVLLALETEDMPQGQALAELLMAYFDLGKRSTNDFSLPTNERGLAHAVLAALGSPESINHVDWNPLSREPDAWHRQVTLAALNGGLAELKSVNMAQREKNMQAAERERARKGPRGPTPM